jgi:hypothetical protein
MESVKIRSLNHVYQRAENLKDKRTCTMKPCVDGEVQILASGTCAA